MARHTPLEMETSFHPNEPKKSMKSWWIKTILLLALVVLSIVMLFELGGYLTGEDTPQLTIPQLLQRIDYPFLLLLLGAVLLYILVESGKYSYLLKVYTGKYCFKTSVKTMFLGKYYDGITPFNTGGQPIQIYYLHKKHDIPGGAATAIPILRYTVSVLLLSIFSIVMLVLSPKYLPTNAVNVTAIIVSWISLGINVIFPITIVLFSIFPGTSKKIITGIIKILTKLHLVKNKYRTTNKFLRGLNEYSVTLRQFWMEIYKYIPLLILCVIEILLLMTIPFLVVLAIGNVEPSVHLAIQIACLVVITRYTALLIPTPGNTGAAEAAGSLVFVTVAGIGPVIGWVLLFWRFLTYYMYILSGIGINIFEIIRSAIKNRHKPTDIEKRKDF